MREAYVEGGRTRQRLGRRLTDDEILKIDEKYHRWVAALTQNVRYCRRVGPKETPFEDLTADAWENIETTATRNGWPVPPSKIEGLEPYVPKKADFS
jgi:hypothetical protein